MLSATLSLGRSGLKPVIGSDKACTDNPFYTNTQYNDKIRYNDNLTVTKPSLKR